MSAGPENGRLLKAAIYWARQHRAYLAAPSPAYREACLDRMLAEQLAAELEPPPSGWGYAGGFESRLRAAEVAELLPRALRPDGA